MDRNMRIALIVGGIILAVLVLVPLAWYGFSGWQGGGWGGWGMMGPWMMGGVGGLGMIPMILFWGLIIWGIVWLARGSGGGGMSHSDHAEHHDSAMDILKSRYARGEINKQEFEDKKRDLI